MYVEVIKLTHISLESSSNNKVVFKRTMVKVKECDFQHNVISPHPLLFFLCICKQLPDVGLRLSDVLVENLWAIDDLWLPGIKHLANLSCHQGFTAAWGSIQQDSLHMLAAWRQRHTTREKGIEVRLSTGTGCSSYQQGTNTLQMFLLDLFFVR